MSDDSGSGLGLAAGLMGLCFISLLACVFEGLAAAGAEPRRRESDTPPERLLTSVVGGGEVTTVALSDAHTVCRLDIRPGVEVFTQPLPKGKHFKLIFTGACAIKQHSSPWYGLDVCYSADTYDHNYKHRHHKLLLDGKTPPKDPIEEDRAEHRYVFVYEATGGRLAVLLEPTILAIDAAATTGSIQLCVVPLTASEELALGLDSVFARECAQERTRAEEARAQQEKRTHRALALATLAHLESNFLQPEYQQHFAAKHNHRILTRDRHEWFTEYLDLITDEPLYDLVQEQYPHVLEFFEARFQVIRIAEQLAVEPTPEPLDPEPEHKETPEEWRDRKLRGLRVEADDKIATMLERFESAKRLRKQAEQMGLDEDVIERLEQQLLGDLDQDEDDHRNGFKQL